ncbi:hypothetical protein [Cohnella abietis]|uniref:hypothetical protein n=1 Tax=Cohnella abietis TaxID=2507935 RepID=UPI0013006433|nr:hypothetical protein [Cohnella abietis]
MFLIILGIIVIGGTLLIYIGPRLLQGRAEMANNHYKEAQETFAMLYYDPLLPF